MAWNHTRLLAIGLVCYLATDGNQCATADFCSCVPRLVAQEKFNLYSLLIMWTKLCPCPSHLHFLHWNAGRCSSRSDAIIPYETISCNAEIKFTVHPWDPYNTDLSHAFCFVLIYNNGLLVGRQGAPTPKQSILFCYELSKRIRS